MKKLTCVLTVLLVLTGYTSFAQLFWLNKDRKQIARGYHIRTTTTDSTLIFQTDSLKFSPSKRTFHFDRNGKCDWIVVTFSCEKCYMGNLTPIITSKRYRWAQPDSLTYVSDRLKVELHKHYQNNPYSYFLKRIGN